MIVVSAGCSAKPYVMPSSGHFSGGSAKIYVVSHGWHTGLVVPAEDIYRYVPELRERFGNTLQIEFGWGDKGFYQAKEITSGLTMRAIFWPTESVMHTVSVPEDVHEYFPYSIVEKICLNEQELSRLMMFISVSFDRDDNHKIIKLKNGLYGNSQFYKGIGNYYLMNTCNKWTAKGIRSAGIPVAPMFKLTAGSVINSVKGGKYCSE